MPTVLTSIRIPKELYEWVAETAKKKNRSISNMIVSILQNNKDRKENIVKIIQMRSELDEQLHINTIPVEDLKKILDV